MKKNQPHLSYLFLALFSLVPTVGIETLSGKVAFLTLPEMTQNIAVSTLYVISGTMFIAFIASTKLTTEQRYILYLSVLALVFFRIIILLEGLF